MANNLSGKVALVAGATRGCGRAIAVELARAGAYVYATGRSSRVAGRSEMNRPETIEETGELMATAGGTGVALRVDHLEPGEVSALVERVDAEQGRLDILVNDIFGGDAYAQFGKKLWEHDVPGGLRMLRMGIDTHLITAALALPLVLRHPGGLVIEMTDRTFEYNKAYVTEIQDPGLPARETGYRLVVICAANALPLNPLSSSSASMMAAAQAARNCSNAPHSQRIRRLTSDWCGRCGNRYASLDGVINQAVVSFTGWVRQGS